MTKKKDQLPEKKLVHIYMETELANKTDKSRGINRSWLINTLVRLWSKGTITVKIEP